MEQFEMKLKPDYVKLLDLLCRALNAGVTNDDERSSIARGLTDKFINHALTVLYLSDGTKTNLPSFLFGLTDFISIGVLTRVSLEAFLTFHYVFYAPTTKEEKDYRYWCYKAAGIAERQDAPASTEEYKQKQAEEKKELNRLRDKLEANAIFQNLTQGQGKQILKGKWKLPSWYNIAIDAGFSGILASDMYRLLSGFAHSSFLSVVQSVEIQKNRKQQDTISSSMVIMNIVIANMTKEYCGLFSKAQDVLSKDYDGSYIVDWWIQVDRHLNKFRK